MNDLFIQLSLILGIVVALSALMRFLRQPMIIAYILTGVIVGPLTHLLANSGDLTIFSHLGIALLLFIVGLGMQPQIIREVGKVAFLTATGQLIITTLAGFCLASALGLSLGTALFLGFCFALSSTIIIVKLLNRKGEHETLYGRISIGFLLVQDLAAMLFSIFIVSWGSASGDALSLFLIIILKFIAILLASIILIRYVIPKLDRLFGNNNELLFIFSLGFCLITATIFYYLNLSMELGALLAGIILASSPYQREIAVKLSPLRDFFLVIFFVSLGTQLEFAGLRDYWPMIIAFSAFVIIGNPLIMMAIMRRLNYTLRTSFYSGLTVSQISEFSLILLALGVSLGQVPAQIIGPATMIGLITIAASTYLVTYNHALFRLMESPLRQIFGDAAEKRHPQLNDNLDVIIFGCHRLGGGLISELRRMKHKFLIIDHNPSVINSLKNEKIPCLYGSADDSGFLDSLDLQHRQLYISTIPDVNINQYLLKYLKNRFRQPNFICSANHLSDAEQLYRLGANFVIMPTYLGRRFMTDFLRRNKLDPRKYRAESLRHRQDLKRFGHAL